MGLKVEVAFQKGVRSKEVLLHFTCAWRWLEPNLTRPKGNDCPLKTALSENHVYSPRNAPMFLG